MCGQTATKTAGPATCTTRTFVVTSVFVSADPPRHLRKGVRPVARVRLGPRLRVVVKVRHRRKLMRPLPAGPTRTLRKGAKRLARRAVLQLQRRLLGRSLRPSRAVLQPTLRGRAGGLLLQREQRCHRHRCTRASTSANRTKLRQWRELLRSRCQLRKTATTGLTRMKLRIVLR